MAPSQRKNTLLIWLVAVAAATLLGGCGLFGGAEESPTPVPTRTPFPTFTATPAVAVTPTLAPPTVAPAADTQAAAALPLTQTATLTETAPAAPPAAAPTPTPAPAAATLTIASDIVNVRSGPGTDYDLVGTAANGESFSIVAKNAAGDWWEICCVGGQNGWVFGELATVQNADAVAVAADLPAAPVAEATAPPANAVAAAPAPEAAPAEAATAEAATAEAATAEAPAPAAPYDPTASSAGNFDPNAQYQIVHFKVLGLDENNGGIRDSTAQHLIFLTVLDQNGNGVDGAMVRNLVGDKSEVTTGTKGPGKAEITMYYEPFKLTVASDPSGPVTSQVSNQMGLIFPHLPDLVGKLGDVNYEYGACPTLEIKCQWPLSAIHFSYEITFQKVK
jgi:SH3-like domain-containing protein